MDITKIFNRSINLFRGQARRAESQDTTLWGLLRLARREATSKAALENIGRRVLSGKIDYLSLTWLSVDAKKIFTRVFEDFGIPTGVLTSPYLLNQTLARLAQTSTDPEILTSLSKNQNTVTNFGMEFPLNITIAEIAARNPMTPKKAA
jgi:hypothetical protein